MTILNMTTFVQYACKKGCCCAVKDLVGEHFIWNVLVLKKRLQKTKSGCVSCARFQNQVDLNVVCVVFADARQSNVWENVQDSFTQIAQDGHQMSMISFVLNVLKKQKITWKKQQTSKNKKRYAAIDKIQNLFFFPNFFYSFFKSTMTNNV